MFVDLNVKLLYESSKMPIKAHDDDFGIDFFAAETVKIWPRKRKLISLGIATEITPGFGILLCDRSGMAAKRGLHVIAGVIDASYRGPWKACLINLDQNSQFIQVGDKIVQGIVIPVPIVTIQEVTSLNETERGGNGFGSTGV